MLDDFSQHVPHPYFDAKDGELLIGGRRVSVIATELGHTPFYAYDRAVMTRKVHELRTALPKDVEIHYAMKANPMPEVVEHFCSLLDGIDVASADEMDVALAAGESAGRVSFAGPGKSPSELERAVEAGIVVNMESVLEMRRLAAIAGSRPVVGSSRNHSSGLLSIERAKVRRCFMPLENSPARTWPLPSRPTSRSS